MLTTGLLLVAVATIFFKINKHHIKQDAPIITFNDAPPIGYSIIAIKLAKKINPGPAGPDQEWDFSAVKSGDDRFDTGGYSKVINRLASPDGNPETDSGFCVEAQKGAVKYNMYYVLNQSVFLDTVIESQGHSVTWPVAKPELKFPFRYGEMFIKPTQKEGRPVHNDTVIYDAYGDLKTPFGNFHNVVRLHFIDGKGEPNYEWWTARPFFPLFCYTPSGGLRFYIPIDKQN